MMWLIFFLISQWEIVSRMPTPRYGLSVIAYDNKIYAIGGKNEDGILGVIEVYNTVTDTWEIKQRSITPRYNMASCVVDGKIFLIGGITDSGITKKVEVYDIMSDSIYAISPLPEPLEGAGACVMGDSIFVIGGYGRGNFNGEVYIYDLNDSTWTTYFYSLLRPRAGLFVGVYSDTIYAVGGVDSFGPLRTVEMLIPDSSWEYGSPLFIERGYVSGVLIDTLLFIIGGESSIGVLSSVEYYNFNTEEWDFFYDLNFPRMGHGSVYLDTNLYVIGGLSGTQILDIVEKFDLSTGINEDYKKIEFYGSYKTFFSSSEIIKLLSKSKNLKLFDKTGKIKLNKIKPGEYFLFIKDKKKIIKILVIK